ncbi:MAG: preprotein translocase subunit SecE [Planctomycetia bacterium TMED53]|nr:MAG: preprotein translocase subunit SecE [Planctomycetia bacterium TMED53]
MSFRLYKEGQGKWARGVLAVILFGVGLFATVSIANWLEGNGTGDGDLFTIPFLELGVQTRSLVSVLVFVPFLLAGIWYYNKPSLSDFLIDTEAELENKVTWPTREETTRNSLVVCVTAVIILGWIMLADGLLQVAKNWVYA